jgi:hypothetical protein
MTLTNDDEDDNDDVGDHNDDCAKLVCSRLAAFSVHVTFSL